MDLKEPSGSQQSGELEAGQSVVGQGHIDGGAVGGVTLRHDIPRLSSGPLLSPLVVAGVLLFGLVMAAVWPVVQPGAVQEEPAINATVPDASHLFMAERTARNKLSIQTHSARVYAALNAALAADSSATTASIVVLVGPDCMTQKFQMAANRPAWPAAPAQVASCTISANGENFVVTVVGDSSAFNFISINGQ